MEAIANMKTGALSNLNSHVDQLAKSKAIKKQNDKIGAPGMDPRQAAPIKAKDKTAIIGLTVDTKV